MALIEKLGAIGDAIRAKTGGSELLTLDEMPTEIAAIKTGGGSSFSTDTHDVIQISYAATGGSSSTYIWTDWAEYITDLTDIEVLVVIHTGAPFIYVKGVMEGFDENNQIPYLTTTGTSNIKFVDTSNKSKYHIAFSAEGMQIRMGSSYLSAQMDAIYAVVKKEA